MPASSDIARCTYACELGHSPLHLCLSAQTRCTYACEYVRNPLHLCLRVNARIMLHLCLRATAAPPPHGTAGPLWEPSQGSRVPAQQELRQPPRHRGLPGLFGSHPKVLGSPPKKIYNLTHRHGCNASEGHVGVILCDGVGVILCDGHVGVILCDGVGSSSVMAKNSSEYESKPFCMTTPCLMLSRSGLLGRSSKR